MRRGRGSGRWLRFRRRTGEGSSSFLKKRTKKLLFIAARACRVHLRNKSFLFLFFKKEILPCFALSVFPRIDVTGAVLSGARISLRKRTLLYCTTRSGIGTLFQKAGAAKRPVGRGSGATGVCSRRCCASSGHNDISRIARQVFSLMGLLSFSGSVGGASRRARLTVGTFGGTLRDAFHVGSSEALEQSGETSAGLAAGTSAF